MSIKKIIKILPFFILMAISLNSFASSVFFIAHPKSIASNIINDSLRIEQIKNRVTEIQNMDMTNLSANEKTSLRKELVSMKKEAKMMYEGGGGHSGVYISIGGLIIIILLLILLLR